ncbi:hypothetical protein ERJ75_001514200 [Trypanosoma vivax]|nr:hypothetical protein ERJ75_001514200 [Trypanosoma vivax]
MRSCVCIILSLKSDRCHVAEDGCIILAVQQMPFWEEFLLSLPQDVWQNCVQKHRDWRLGTAPKLQERKRQLLKMAYMFHFFRVQFEECMGSQSGWKEQFLLRM